MEKKRCTNFTNDEVELLVCLVEEHKHVVECKKTDAVTCTAKENEWKKIESKFNAACGTGRTAKMLRSKWDSLKKSIKKDYAQQKQSLYRTGGGPPIEIKLTGVGDRILTIIGVGATGTVSQFDSDFVSNEVPNANIEPPVSNIEFLDVSELPSHTSTDKRDEFEELTSCSWNSWNPQLLREPKNKILQVSNSLDNPSTPGREAITERNKNDPEEMEDALTPKTVTSTSKRKRFYKIGSTSSKLQKQRSGSTVYEELARKKMEFIDFQINLMKEEAERKESRLAEKHQLEIKILEAQLKENYQ